MPEALYEDSLIRMTEESILFRHYYFPFGAKRIELASIASVEVLKPSLLSGRWRIHGTGDFRTWFARDTRRPRRDLLFVLHRRGKWRRIGFTAEDSAAVMKIFKDLGLAVDTGQPGNEKSTRAG